MRTDAIGLFWEDLPPPPKEKKQKEKVVPPEPIWLEPDYLPHLDVAKAYQYDLFTDQELYDVGIKFKLTGERHQLTYDIECYPNYFLVAFKSIETGQIVYFENDELKDNRKLLWMLENFTLVGFGSWSYDTIMLSLAVKGLSTQQLKEASDLLIVEDMRPQDVLKKYKCKRLQFDQIDLIETCPGAGSLKIYGGRVHTKRMQDLPFEPNTVLTPDHITIVRWYCVNDLDTTIDLNNQLSTQLTLRDKMGKKFGVDLRSKSDPQMAEAVIGSSIKKITGSWPNKGYFEPGTYFHYNIPDFIKYESDLMNWALDRVRCAQFVLSDTGKITMPPELNNMELPLGTSTYKVGIGGLHSKDETACYIADENTILTDRDMTSYYPKIILTQELFPPQLGRVFLDVYGGIVDERIKSKQKLKTEPDNEDLAIIVDSLKIVINGMFGKLGNVYSLFYSPQLLIQVTLTGQLSLLMLIERLELAGISVISANTDGIVLKCTKDNYELANQICKQTEIDTGLELEETLYKAIYSRDVNNYFAVKTDGKVKRKGSYAKNGLFEKKNPTNEICSLAVSEYLLNGKTIEDTIKSNTDIRNFVTVRKVNGGAVKVWGENEIDYLGKAIRWYYAQDVDTPIIYAKSGNKVPKSDGAKPLMLLPDTIPEDIDYDWYINESYKILKEVGVDVCDNLQ